MEEIKVAQIWRRIGVPTESHFNNMSRDIETAPTLTHSQPPAVTTADGTFVSNRNVVDNDKESIDVKAAAAAAKADLKMTVSVVVVLVTFTS